ELLDHVAAERLEDLPGHGREPCIGIAAEFRIDRQEAGRHFDLRQHRIGEHGRCDDDAVRIEHGNLPFKRTWACDGCRNRRPSGAVGPVDRLRRPPAKSGLAPATAGDGPWAGLSAWGSGCAASASAASDGEHDDNAWEPPFWFFSPLPCGG